MGKSGLCDNCLERPAKWIIDLDDPMLMCDDCYRAFDFGQDVFDVTSGRIGNSERDQDETFYGEGSDWRQMPVNGGGVDEAEIADIYREAERRAWGLDDGECEEYEDGEE